MFKYALLATTMNIAAPALAQTGAPTTSPSATSGTPQTAPQTTTRPTPGSTVDTPSASPTTTAPSTSGTATTTTNPDAATTTPAPDSTAPTDGTATSTPPPAGGTSTPMADAGAASGTAQTASQPTGGVAGVVKAEFPTYDKDKNGALSSAEFGSWMGALRKASEPGFNAGTREARTWVDGAFTQADADKSKSINEGELTTFLSASAKTS